MRKFDEEEIKKIFYKLVSGLTEHDIKDMWSRSGVGDVLYFHVFHFQIKDTVYFKAFYTLAGKEFKFNKVIEGFSLLTPVISKELHAVS